MGTRGASAVGDGTANAAEPTWSTPTTRQAHVTARRARGASTATAAAAASAAAGRSGSV